MTMGLVEDLREAVRSLAPLEISGRAARHSAAVAVADGDLATLVVGVGNAARGDDGAGPAVVEELRQTGMKALDAGDVPERYLGPISESGASVVLFVDAVDFGGRPGEAALLAEHDLPQRSCVTHRSGLGLVMRYLREQAGQRSLLLGVQPGCVALGQGLTPPLRAAVKGVAAAVREALGDCRPERPGRGMAACARRQDPSPLAQDDRHRSEAGRENAPAADRRAEVRGCW